MSEERVDARLAPADGAKRIGRLATAALRVSTRVNTPKHDDEKLLEPVE